MKRKGPSLRLSDITGASSGGGAATAPAAANGGPAAGGLAGGPAGRRAPPRLGGLPPSGGGGGGAGAVGGSAAGTPFANFSKIVDPSGRLRFGGKAVLHAKGVDFSNGSSFAINMEELTLLEELGKGNYGTVQKVFHKPTKVVMAMKVRRCPVRISQFEVVAEQVSG